MILKSNDFKNLMTAILKSKIKKSY